MHMHMQSLHHTAPNPNLASLGNYPDLDFPLASLIRKLDRLLQPIGIPKKTKYLVDDPILHAFGGLRNFVVLSPDRIEYKSGVARLLLPLHSIPPRVFQLPHLLAFDLCYYINARGGSLPLAAVEAAFARHTSLASVADIIAKYKKLFQVRQSDSDGGPVLQVQSPGPHVLPFMLARKFADAFVNNAALVTTAPPSSTSSSSALPVSPRMLPPPTASTQTSSSFAATVNSLSAPTNAAVSPPRPTLPYARIHMDPSEWAPSPTAHLDSSDHHSGSDAETLPEKNPSNPEPSAFREHDPTDTDTTHDGDLTSDSIPPFASLPPLPETDDDTATSSAFDDASSSAHPPPSLTPDPAPLPVARTPTTPSPLPAPRSSSPTRPVPHFGSSSSPSKLPPALKSSPTNFSSSSRPNPAQQLNSSTYTTSANHAPSPPITSLKPLFLTIPRIDHKRHYLYIIQSAAHANAFRTLHLPTTLPHRLALDLITDPTMGQPDVVQLAFPDPSNPYRSVVSLWDFARAHREEHVGMRILLRGMIKSVVSKATAAAGTSKGCGGGAEGGEIVVHGAQRLSHPHLLLLPRTSSSSTSASAAAAGGGLKWIDPTWPLLDTNVLFRDWHKLAADAHELVAALDQHAQHSPMGAGGELAAAANALRMPSAKRARLLAPVLDPDLRAQGVGCGMALNAVLRACQRRTNELRDKVDAWTDERARRHGVGRLQAARVGTGSEGDRTRGGGAGVVRTATGGMLPAAPPLQPRDGAAVAARNGGSGAYWDLHPDTELLARAAAQDVDQLVVVAGIMDQRMDELTLWMRRVKSFLALTEYARGGWSVDPVLPKHVAVQARFDAQQRLAWRYPCDEAAGHEQDQDMPQVSQDLQAIHDRFAKRTAVEVNGLVRLLPDRIRQAIRRIPHGPETLNEVIMDLGERPRLRFFHHDKAPVVLKELPAVTEADIDAIIGGRKFSSDRRGGINGQLHRISWIANREGQAVGLTIRVGRACAPGEGVTQMLLDLVQAGESVLLLGKPGSGKTHTLRDFVARLSDKGNNVMVVDTSNEVGGPGDIKHFSLHNARRMQVRDRARQFEVLLEAVQNHTPDIVCVDEISDAKEVAAARSVVTRVQGMVATAHGSLESILRNKELRLLVGGLQTVVIGDTRAKEMGGRKTLTTRIEESLFSSVVELVSRTEVRVFRNVSRTIDDILHPQRQPWAERRWFDIVPQPVVALEPVNIVASGRGAAVAEPRPVSNETNHVNGSRSSSGEGNGSASGKDPGSCDGSGSSEFSTDDCSSGSQGDDDGDGDEDVDQSAIERRTMAPRHFWVRVEPFAKLDLESVAVD